MKTKSLVLPILLGGLSLWWSATALALVDSDGDLLPDSWEQQYFSSTTAALPNDDPEGDRLTNLDERFAGTEPTVYTSAASLSESQLLRLFQGKAFLFFWEQSELPYFFTHDNAHYDGNNSSQNFNSNAAVGFSFVAYVVADQNDWVKHTDAYHRIRTALVRLVELQGASYGMIGVPLTQQGNRHGLTYHFMDNNGFRAFSNVEISTIDHALLTAGALLAASYYPGTEVEDLAHQLFDNTDWRWLYDGNFFYQGWLEGCASGENCIEGGHTLDAWNRYSELMILLFQTMSAEGAKGVGPEAWQQLAFGNPNVMFPNEWVDISPGSNPQNFTFLSDMPDVSQAAGFENNPGRFRYIHAGSIHNHQYSHMFADFRHRPDGFRQTDFFANSINATMANREFCIQLNAHAFGGDPGSPDLFLQQPYETYGPNSWGLLAGIVSDGTYKVMQPIVVSWDDFSPQNIAANNDSGTVFLPAPLGSTAFAPREVIDFARNLLTRFQANETGYDALVNRYGFMNSFNLGRGFYRSDPPGHFSVMTIGIDLGAVVGGIENHLTGLPWKFSMRQSRITDGMANGAGFNIGNVEPFILNFDDNPPAPSEDTNGGGQDPNSFGAGMFEFGAGASIQYAFIGDPRPDIPYGPQNWAADIQTVNNVNDGGFILLNNHSVSHWDRVSFWIKGDGAGQDFSVGLKDSTIDFKGAALQATEVKLPIKDFFSSGQIPTDWTEVRIPLSEFETRGVRLTRLDNISFTNLRPAGGRIWVDDIAFLGDEFPPAAPKKIRITPESGDLRLQWDESPERDVVGYNVYRRLPNAAYTKLTSHLAVEPTYLDLGANGGEYQYAVTAVDNAKPQNESAFGVNLAPQLVPAGPFTINEEQTIQFTVTATDGEGDALVLSSPNLNESGGATFEPGVTQISPDGTSKIEGIFQWTPRWWQAGKTHFVQFYVTDPNGGSASRIVQIQVIEINQPPYISPIIGNKTAVVNQLLKFGFYLINPDGFNLTVDVQNIVPPVMPQGATLSCDSMSGCGFATQWCEFKWTPAPGQEGPHTAQFTPCELPSNNPVCGPTMTVNINVTSA